MIKLVAGSLRYYWRTNAAVVAGVAVAVAVLAGALLVGQSVRGSLRDLLNERIGATDYVVSADRFFREALAAGLARAETDGGRATTAPMIAVSGVLARDDARRRAYDVGVFGIDERFWRFHGIAEAPAFEDRGAVVGAPLAAYLGIRPGDSLLLTIGNGMDVPGESLYGRRENAEKTIRLRCSAVAAPAQLGEFALRPHQAAAFSVFVPLARLQRELDVQGRINTVLVATAPGSDDSAWLRRRLGREVTPEDAGIRIRDLGPASGVSVESSRILLDEGSARAAVDAAGSSAGVSGVFAYVTNTIRVRGREIPYSVIVAADLGSGALSGTKMVAGPPMQLAPPDPQHAIWLNEWAAKDLGAAVGDSVDIEYYAWDDAGGLLTRNARFVLAGIVAIGGDVSRDLVPEVPGVTTASSLRGWDPPFPLDLSRIRQEDEEYWNRYGATPKAFVTLATGQALWQSRFGRLTAVRVLPPPATFVVELARRIDAGMSGFSVTAVRRDGLEAARGAVDLGEYFLYFSFFLIVAAVVLSASFFKLGVEQRAREVGALRALGFPLATLRRIFFAEGFVLLAVGSAVGAAGAIAFGGLLVLGLRTWWVGAVGTERVALHVSWVALAVGSICGGLASLAAIAWTLRGLAQSSARELLAGEISAPASRTKRARVLLVTVVCSLVVAAAILGASAAGLVASVEGFFAAGSLLLAASICLVALALRRARPEPISGSGWRPLLRLSFRGAAHRPARSLVPVALIASATFIVVSVDAFRKEGGEDVLGRRSGTGGYAFLATSPLPALENPTTAAGREAVGLGGEEAGDLGRVKFVPFRERPGDDASCQNLYAPRDPRVLGAPKSFLDEGRFAFGSSLAATVGERENPWLLLAAPSRDGVIPAIADANSLEYSLHLKVGEEVALPGAAGAPPVRLRIVAALKDSILQGALIVSEDNFLKAFPQQEGFRFFLVDVPRGSEAALAGPLTERLADAGIRLESSGERLAGYHRVENTYLSTFQALGGLGLVLGTVGLLAVLLRNLFERRSELALLRAVGYRQPTLAAMLVAEQLLLLACGLTGGTLSALVAITPALASRGGAVPFATIGMLLAAVGTAGILSSLAGGFAVLRAPLVSALRSE